MMKMKLFAFVLLCVAMGPSVAIAQYNPDKIGRKALSLYEQAMEQGREGNFTAGIRLLQDAVKIEPGFADAYLSIAGMYGEQKNYDRAIEFYEKARSVDNTYFRDYNLPYSINLAGRGEFEKALAAVQQFLQTPGLRESSVKAGAYRERTYRFAIEMDQKLKASNYRFEPKNMGDSINSQVSEYYPTVTIDGSKFVYTRRVRNYNEDFFEALSTEKGWSQSRALIGSINTQQNEGAQVISQDGEWLIFTGCNFPEGYGSCDLYISYLTPDGWSAPENLGNLINTETWESAPSLSPDKRDLYFTSRRSGGYGGSDIYVSRRQPNGRWGMPQNLGPEINTIGDESAPFIHADNQTLYFTSNGHLGYGGDDLFVARKLKDNSWGKAENLGFPINTIENEGSIFIAANGSTAYYASDRADSKGGLDIYSFELREDVRPARTLWVKGKVYDSETNKGLPSAVELTDLSTKQILSKVQTDETGNYLITLPVGKDYAFNVNRRGYLFFSENFPMSQKIADSTYHIDIPLKPIKANATIVLNNIFFDVNSFEIRPESTVELDQIVALMKDNPSLRIQINGHTDNVGKPQDNLLLSRNRSKAVVNYLISKGIEANRLASQGYGETQPLADNNTAEGRAKNRRTEMKVLSQ